MLSPNPADVELALKEWVATTSGLPVRWAEQQGNVPEGDFVTMQMGPSITVGGPDEETYTYDSTAPAGAEITIAEKGTREFTLTVQCYAGRGKTVGNSSPRAVLANVRASLGLPDVRAGLAAVSLSPFAPGPIRDVSARSGTIFEPRALFECRFYVREQVTETTGYIATVGPMVGTYTEGAPEFPYEF